MKIKVQKIQIIEEELEIEENFYNRRCLEQIASLIEEAKVKLVDVEICISKLNRI